MGVVAPITGLLAAVVPAGFGIATQGPPGPLVVVGIVAALIAVVLVARVPDTSSGRSGIELAILAGVGLGAFSVLISHVTVGGVFGPLAAVRVVEAALVGGAIVATRRPWRLPAGLVVPVLGIGALDMAGNALFVLAEQAGRLDVAAVLSSLYPVTTVVLAAIILRERVTRMHAVGIGLAVAAIVLIASG
jgi:drug/metabolite transporter (DMT)-like permease